jgi:hypothetical protein
MPHPVCDRSTDPAFDAFCATLADIFAGVNAWEAAGRPNTFNLQADFHDRIKALYATHTNTQLMDFVWSLLFIKYLPETRMEEVKVQEAKVERPGTLRTLLGGLLGNREVPNVPARTFRDLGPIDGPLIKYLFVHLVSKWFGERYTPPRSASSLFLDFLLRYATVPPNGDRRGLEALAAVLYYNFVALCARSLPVDRELCRRLLVSGRILSLKDLQPVFMAMHMVDVLPYPVFSGRELPYTPEQYVRFAACTAAIAAGCNVDFDPKKPAPFWDRKAPFMPQIGVFFEVWLLVMKDQVGNGLSAQKAVSWWLSYSEDCRSFGEVSGQSRWVDWADALMFELRNDPALVRGLPGVQDDFLDLLVKAGTYTWTLDPKAKCLRPENWSPETTDFVDAAAQLLSQDPEAVCVYKGESVSKLKTRPLHMALALRGHTTPLMGLVRFHLSGKGVEEKLRNSAIRALGYAPSDEAVPFLVSALDTVPAPAKKVVETALKQHALAAGVDLDTLLEDSVPDVGLWPAGRLWAEYPEGSVGLVWRSGKVAVVWRSATGKEVATTPAALKASYPELAKEIRAKAVLADKVCTVQRHRLEKMLSSPAWVEASLWRERFIDHPTLGALVIGTVWEIRRQAERMVCFVGPQGPVLLDGTPMGGVVEYARLWHPSGADALEIAAVRNAIQSWSGVPVLDQANRWSLASLGPTSDSGSQGKGVTLLPVFEGFVIRQLGMDDVLRSLGWKVKLCIDADAAQEGRWVVEDQALGLSLSVHLHGVGSMLSPNNPAYLYAVVGPVRIDKADAVPLDTPDVLRMLSQRLGEVHSIIQRSCVCVFPWSDVKDHKKTQSVFRTTTLPPVFGRTHALASAYGLLSATTKPAAECITKGDDGSDMALCLATGVARAIQTGELRLESVVRAQPSPPLIGGFPVETPLVWTIVERLRQAQRPQH